MAQNDIPLKFVMAENAATEIIEKYGSSLFHVGKSLIS